MIQLPCEKLNTLKNSTIMEKKGDKLQTAYDSEPVGIKYPFCGLSIEELNL